MPSQKPEKKLCSRTRYGGHEVAGRPAPPTDDGVRIGQVCMLSRARPAAWSWRPLCNYFSLSTSLRLTFWQLSHGDAVLRRVGSTPCSQRSCDSPRFMRQHLVITTSSRLPLMVLEIPSATGVRSRPAEAHPHANCWTVTIRAAVHRAGRQPLIHFAVQQVSYSLGSSGLGDCPWHPYN